MAKFYHTKKPNPTKLSMESVCLYTISNSSIQRRTCCNPYQSYLRLSGCLEDFTRLGQANTRKWWQVVAARQNAHVTELLKSVKSSLNGQNFIKPGLLYQRPIPIKIHLEYDLQIKMSVSDVMIDSQVMGSDSHFIQLSFKQSKNLKDK